MLNRLSTFFFASLVLISTLLLLSCSEPPLRLGVTTTLEDSGLLHRLTTDFYNEHGISIAPIVAGSGQLFSLIKRGDVDIAITHEPEGEKQLVEQGFISSRQAVFHNDFVIVGSREDPANIRNAASTRDAFARLIRSDSVYISRNDNSGTHRMEQFWWSQVQALFLTPSLTSTVTPSLAPQASPSNLLLTGTGMGETLTVAANKNAYTLVDIGTWLAFKNKQNLTILWRDSQTLRNEYHLLTLNFNSIQKTEKTHKKSHIFSQWIHEWANKNLQSDIPIETSKEQSAEYNPPNKIPFFVDNTLTNNQREQQQEQQQESPP